MSASTQRNSSPAETSSVSPDAVAREIALRRLTTRAHSRHELAQAMARKNVPAEAAEQVLDRFTEVGLIDDDAYAQAWVASRHGVRHDSRRAVTAQLRQRGIADEIIAQATSEIGFDAELAAARALIQRRGKRFAGPAPEVAQRRMAGMLARKGYGSSVVVAVLREVLAASLDALDEPAVGDS